MFTVNGVRYNSHDEASAVLWKSGGLMTSDRSPEAEARHVQWCELYDQRKRADELIRKELCEELAIPWNNGSGSYGCHCICGIDQIRKVWFSENGHEFRCPHRMPQFWYKPTDFQLRWYKYIGRDMEGNRELSAEEIGAMLQVCLCSLGGMGAGKLQQ